MGDACAVCKGHGYVWTGAARVVCWRCDGRGAELPGPRRERRPMPEAPDPMRSRRR
jgi:hypothetical protein